MKKQIKISVLIFTTALSLSATICIQGQNRRVLLFDKFGITIYNTLTSKKQLIYKSDKNDIFLHEPIEAYNDTIVFGIKGQLIHDLDSAKIEQYTKLFYSLCLSSGKTYLSKKIDYILKDKDLKIQTTTLSNSGVVLSKVDSITKWRRGMYSKYSVEYNEAAETYFSRSIMVNGVSAFSREGNIYLISNGDTSLLVEYGGFFDIKNGSGYYQPQMSSSGTFLLFMSSSESSLSNFRIKPALHKFDLLTRRMERIEEGHYSNLSLSSDDRFLLYNIGRSIYILDLATMKKKYIGKGNFAQWLE